MKSKESLLDEVNRLHAPIVAAMHANPLPAAGLGQRYIVTRDGLMREVLTPWLRLRADVAYSRGSTPYAHLPEEVELFCGQPSKDLWAEFIAHAKRVYPLECAGLMVWNKESKAWRLAMRESTSASADHVQYREPDLGDDEVGVCDVHSHGVHPAFFSATDDEDDRGAIKISAVIGRVDQETPEIILRLVCLDVHRKVRLSNTYQFICELKR